MPYFHWCFQLLCQLFKLEDTNAWCPIVEENTQKVWMILYPLPLNPNVYSICWITLAAVFIYKYRIVNPYQIEYFLEKKYLCLFVLDVLFRYCMYILLDHFSKIVFTASGLPHETELAVLACVTSRPIATFCQKKMKIVFSGILLMITICRKIMVLSHVIKYFLERYYFMLFLIFT